MDDDRIYTVSRLTGLIKNRLEGEFSDLRVEGEISNFRPSSTGHCYFSLKDKDAVIQAVMFKNRLGSLKFIPGDGNLVRVTGSISVYPPRGSYQLICEVMEKAGQGDILAMLEERKRRLAMEGYFDIQRKVGLPFFPRKIAVVTSPTGAALRDILKVSRRRNPGIDILILPAPVQGADAGPLIAAQIRRASLFPDVEALIVGRGGGSLEDLLPFSDEEVVKAVADSRLPVVTAVGHEIDTCLADFAASSVASTPSAAAEILCPSRRDLEVRIGELDRRMVREIRGRMDRVRLLLEQFSPGEMGRRLRPVLRDGALRLDEARQDLERNMADLLRNRSHRLEVLRRSLEAGSPEMVLRRGFAIVKNSATGALVDSPEKAAKGERLDIEMARGKIRTAVEEIVTK